MSTRITDIKDAVDKIGDAYELSSAKQGKQITKLVEENQELKARIEDIEAKRSSPGKTASDHGMARELKALTNFMRTGDASELQPPETKELGMGTAAAGGAMVPELIANQIIDRAIARSRLVSLVTMTPSSTSDYVRLLNLRGTVASWSSETGTRSDTATPTLREIRVTHGELFSYPAVTRWLLNDSQFKVERFLRDNVEAAFSKSLENAILKGSGTNRPTGILNTTPVSTVDDASPERSADTIQFVTGTSDLANDLITLYFTLKPEYRSGASFVMSSTTLAVVRKLRDTGGSGYLWQQNLSASIDAPDGLLLGRPVVTSEDMDAVAASPTNFSIICGDMRMAYEIIRIGGLSIVRDEVTVPGKIKFYIAQRFGGRLVDNDSAKVLKA